MTVLDRVRRFARRHDLWRADTRVVAALSGGSDSVALLLLCRDLHQRGDLVIAAAAHLHHGIRGEAADDDARFCEELAARLQIPFVVERVDVPARAANDRESIEVAARRARQHFYHRVRLECGADVVATAHTRDDQAETVLLRLTRGTGLRGLGGIAPRRGFLVRPLLDCTRDDLRAELTARQQSWREDATNLDIRQPRNRVRHELLPYLRREFNSAMTASLARLAELARADDEALDAQAAAEEQRLVSRNGHAVAIKAAALAALSPAVARRLVMRVFDALDSNLATLHDVDLVRTVAAGERRAAQIYGIRVEHSGDSVVLVSSDPPPTPFRLDLPIPGRVQSEDAGWEIEAAVRSVAPDLIVPAADEVVVDAASVGAALVVRSRLPGDRLRPLGLGGSKKVQDVLVDRKVGRRQRDQVPIVTDHTGRIVWVAGHVLAEEFRVTGRTNAVVVLKLRRPAAPGIDFA